MINAKETTVALASENEFRRAAFEQLGTQVLSFEGGPEDKTLHPREIMMAKIQHAYREMLATYGYLIGDYLAAVDVMNRIFVPDYKGSITPIIKPKPESEEEILINLMDMSVLADQMGLGHYQVIVASGLLGDNVSKQDLFNVKIDLTRKGLTHLSTEQGFLEYKQIAQELSTADFGVNLLHIPGGIATEVLMAMGVIQNINKVGVSNSSLSKQVFKRAFASITTGIGNNVGQEFHPQSADKLAELPWVESMADRVI